LGYYFLYNIIGVLMWVYKPNYSFATNTKYPFETLVLYWSYSFGPKEFHSERPRLGHVTQHCSWSSNHPATWP
jgi:hypothetical protein